MDTKLSISKNIITTEHITRHWLGRISLRYASVWMSLLMIFSDLASLYLAGLAAYHLRVSMGGIPDPQLYLPFLGLPLIFVIVYAWRSLYRTVGLGAVDEMRRLLVTNTLLFVVLSSLPFLVKSPPVFSRLMFAFAWLLTSVTLPFMRMGLRYLLVSLNLWGAPAIVIFSKELSLSRHEMETTWANQMVRGLKPLLFLQQDATLPYQTIQRMITAYRIKFALVFYQNVNEIETLRKKYKNDFERIIFVQFGSDGLNFSGLGVSDLDGVLGLEFHQRLLSTCAQFQKRILDFVLATILLVLFSPLFLILMAAIVLDSPGCAFFTQPRIGKDGKTFGMIKFRSMRKDAEAYLQKYLAANTAARVEWDTYQKISNDPRITRVGRFLRKTSLDELPQLLNVLVGEMSLVGPRPFTVDQETPYGEAYEYYICVQPGMTGLWQVSGRNHTTFARRAELDVRYVKSWSIWLDLHILIRTIRVVLTRNGAG